MHPSHPNTPLHRQELRNSSFLTLNSSLLLLLTALLLPTIISANPPGIPTTADRTIGTPGFFHLQRQDDYWFVLNPAGEPTYLSGMNHVGDNALYPLQGKRHEDFEEWTASIRSNLLDWNFTYLGPTDARHVDSLTVIKPSERKGRIVKSVEWLFDRNEHLDYPFVAMLNLPEEEYPDEHNYFPDVFSKEFRELVDRHCANRCAPLKDNKHLIGYHLTHNPYWSDLSLSTGGFGRDFTTWISKTVNVPNSPARRQWTNTMRRIYGTVENYANIYYPVADFDEINTIPAPTYGLGGRQWVKKDMVAFIREVAREWYRVWHDSIRKHDPNHLILGDRMSTHFQVIPTYILDVMEPHVDVLSINMMGNAHQMMDNMRDALTYWNKPILVADAGARVWDGTPRSGGLVKTDQQVGEVYFDHIRLGVAHPQIIGLTWCGYWETTNHHSGIVDGVTGETNQTVADLMREANTFAETEVQKRFSR